MNIQEAMIENYKKITANDELIISTLKDIIAKQEKLIELQKEMLNRHDEVKWLFTRKEQTNE